MQVESFGSTNNACCQDSLPCFRCATHGKPMDSPADIDPTQLWQRSNVNCVRNSNCKRSLSAYRGRVKLLGVIIVTAFIVGLTVPSTLAFSSLYTYKDEGISILDSSNFSSFASNNPTALYIEFYNSWCGHCIRYLF